MYHQLACSSSKEDWNNSMTHQLKDNNARLSVHFSNPPISAKLCDACFVHAPKMLSIYLHTGDAFNVVPILCDPEDRLRLCRDVIS
jgi:hypothetical protein